MATPRIERIPECRVRVCPEPSNPDFHVCAVCESPAVHHHHKEPKGMGGSKARDVKENIVMLCPTHHMEEHGLGASSDGEEEGSVERLNPNAFDGQREFSPSSPGASASEGLGPTLPPERVGRDSRGATRARNLPEAVTPPDSLAFQEHTNA